MSREELELLTNIHNLPTYTVFYVILRCKSSEWLELCIESELAIREFVLLKYSYLA